MSLIGKLVGFGLRQVIGVSSESVVQAVEQRFRDHSQTLPRAIERAADRAWQALAVALAGEGFLAGLKGFFSSGDDKGIRDQVTIFLKSSAISFDGSPATFRQACLEELKRLRRSGLLSAQGLTASEVARQAAGFQRQADPLGLVEEAKKATAQVADALPPDYSNLASLLRTPTPAGPPLLAAAFAYFFRREVETDDELAHGLFFDGLRQLGASQAKAFSEVSKALSTLGPQFDEVFRRLGEIEVVVKETQAVAVATHGAVLDIKEEFTRVSGLHLANATEVRSLLEQVQQHLSQLGMQRGEVRQQHSCSIRGEDERRAVKALLARFRQLPANDRQQMPALLNGLGKLQIGAGDFADARQTFGEVVKVVADPAGKAEASYNAYRAALEERKWDAAVAAIREAASLQPQRFAPFPLHRYEPSGILGAGGFGTAFLCHDRNFGEDVVVKTLHAGDLERGLDEVFREARTLRRLSHPSIIGVRDCDYADPGSKSRPYLVMDYFPGITLEDLIEQFGPLDPEMVLSIAVEVAQGMHAAHSQGVLHRDLKPANILICGEVGQWEVKIIDFGLALRKQAIETSMAAHSTGISIMGSSVAGTLKYAPPEQMGELRGVKPGPYSDVYAFGKTCCYALFKTTEPKRRQWASLPTELADALEKCTEQGLDQRYAGFEPVLAVLEALAVPGGKFSEDVEGGSPGLAVEEVNQQTDYDLAEDEEEEIEEYTLRHDEPEVEVMEEYTLGTDQDAEELQKQQLANLQATGETKLSDFVRSVLDRTNGKPVAADTAAANEVCRQFQIPKERAQAVVREAREAWRVEAQGRVARSTEAAEPKPKQITLKIPGVWESRPRDGSTVEWSEPIALSRSPDKLVTTLTIMPGLAYRVSFSTIVTEPYESWLETFKALARCEPLEELSIWDCEKLRDDCLVHLRHLGNLKSVTLTVCDWLTEQGLIHLNYLTNLRELELSHSITPTGKGVEHLTGLAHLQKLNLGSNHYLVEVGIRSPKQFPALTSLDLSGCGGLADTPLDLAGVRNCPRLKQLNLTSCEALSDDALKHVGTLRHLESLDLGGCNQITDDGLQHLRGLTELQTLSLSGCELLCGHSLGFLKNAHGLRSLDLSECEAFSSPLSFLAGKQHLESLNCRGCVSLEVGQLKHLRGLTALKELNLRGCEQLRDDHLGFLRTLTGLRVLNLSGCKWLTDKTLTSIRGLTLLEDLDVCGCTLVTDVGLANLSNLKSLKWLDLDGCVEITSAGLAHLSTLTALERLNLRRCELLTDDGLLHLNELPALQDLNLRDCPLLTREGCLKLETGNRLQDSLRFPEQARDEYDD